MSVLFAVEGLILVAKFIWLDCHSHIGVFVT